MACGTILIAGESPVGLDLPSWKLLLLQQLLLEPVRWGYIRTHEYTRTLDTEIACPTDSSSRKNCALLARVRSRRACPCDVSWPPDNCFESEETLCTGSLLVLVL